MGKQRIGILVGSFDPVWGSHLRLARSAVKCARLDRIVLLPTAGNCSAGFEDRWKMLVTACCRDDTLIPFRPDPFNTVSCSAESAVQLLRGLYPKAVFIRIGGADMPPESRDPDGTDICVREFISCKGLYGSTCRIPESGEWLDRLFASLKPKRFAHSLAVADTARRMAARFGEDALKAEKAGLLHDCAKNLPLPEMQRIARDNHLIEDPDFLASGALLHSVVGAWVARHEYGMTDPDILEAIAYHNTGHAGMSRLAMCVCLSDSIEPTRAPYPLLDEVRDLAEHSLEKALLRSLEGTAGFVTAKGALLHPRTLDTIAWLKALPAI